MRIRHLIPAIAGAALLAGCAERAAPTASPAPAATPVPAVAAIGPARSCVPLQQIRNTRVRSDKVIDFEMVGGEVLRNELPYSCPQLGFEKAFSYSTSLSQLCSTDIITVIIQGGGSMRGASCGLGQFVPISAEAAKAEVAQAR